MYANGSIAFYHLNLAGKQDLVNDGQEGTTGKIMTLYQGLSDILADVATVVSKALITSFQ